MATTYTPPIDLYAESIEDSGEEQHTTARGTTEDRRPDFNGDRDERACERSNDGLQRVLGW